MASRCFNSKMHISNVNGGKSFASSLDNLLKIKNMIGEWGITFFVQSYIVLASRDNISLLSYFHIKRFDGRI